MKIRSDFVTNSSSSSFIVAADADETIPEIYLREMDNLTTMTQIIEALDHSYESDRVFGNLEESYVKKNYDLSDVQMALVKSASIGKADTFDSIMNQIHAGRQVYSTTIDYDWPEYEYMRNYLENLIVLDQN